METLPTPRFSAEARISRKLQEFAQLDLDSGVSPALDLDAIHLWRMEKPALREVLALYTGLKPGDIRFQHRGEGKPCLALDQNPGSLHFNRSHSGALDLIAITRAGEIGVDLERVRPFERMDAFLKRFAFDSERARIMALPDGDRIRGFFEFWTAKEAWCKAHAKSIFNALARYEWDPSDPGYVKLQLDAGYVGHVYLLT